MIWYILSNYFFCELWREGIRRLIKSFVKFFREEEVEGMISFWICVWVEDLGVRSVFIWDIGEYF